MNEDTIDILNVFLMWGGLILIVCLGMLLFGLMFWLFGGGCS